jgi:hypothetical protein
MKIKGKYYGEERWFGMLDSESWKQVEKIE